MGKSVVQNQINLKHIIMESYWLLQANFNLIMIFTFCIYIPFYILEMIIPFESLANEYGNMAVRTLSLTFSLGRYILALLVFTGIAYILQKSIKGEPRTLLDTFRFSFSRLEDVFWASFLSNIICGALMLLFIVPGIVWMNYYSFVLQVTALQGIRGKAALDYSERLVRGMWWKIFGINLALGLASLSFTVPLSFLVRNMLEISVFNSFIHAIIVYTLGSIFSVMHVVLFFNVIQVKELQKLSRTEK